MIFSAYWQQVVEKYPHLKDADGKTTVKVSSLRALMEQAYERGQEHQRALQQYDRLTQSTPKSADWPDWLKGFTTPPKS